VGHFAGAAALALCSTRKALDTARVHHLLGGAAAWVSSPGEYIAFLTHRDVPKTVWHPWRANLFRQGVNLMLEI
jgi:hypothetical protein